MIIGIDVGGANLKIWRGKSESYYFPFWKRRDDFPEFLRSLKIEGEKIGVVITAELSDAFKSKEEGVRFIERSIAENVSGDVYFLNLNGELKRSVDNPLDFSAANWVASVKYLSKIYENFVFVDLGSTTCDVIPFKGKILAAKTDYERLKRGELLYFGMLRTPLCYLLSFKEISSELFSISADAMRVLGVISEEDYSCETPDGRGRSVKECMQRISRQFCADLDEMGEEEVRKISREVYEVMVAKIEKAIWEKMESYGIERVIGCGMGEVLIEDAAKRVGAEYISLSKEFGEEISKIFPAFAVAELLRDDS